MVQGHASQAGAHAAKLDQLPEDQLGEHLLRQIRCVQALSALDSGQYERTASILVNLAFVHGEQYSSVNHIFLYGYTF